MKNKSLIIFLIFLSCTKVLGIQYPTITNSAKYYNYCPYNYNPYGSFYSPYYTNYRYKNPYQYSTPTKTDIKRLNKIRYRNQIKNNIFSLLNNKNYGSMTGYSLPINNGALNLIPKNNQYYSPTNNMELFKNPQSGQEFYFQDGRFYKDIKGLDSKTGVKIIYD